MVARFLICLIAAAAAYILIPVLSAEKQGGEVQSAMAAAEPSTVASPLQPYYKPAPEASKPILFTGAAYSFLQTINKHVNDGIISVGDQDQYGVGDKWVANPPSWMGDCEDYAMTKRSILLNMGIPPESMQIAYVGVYTHGYWQGHAVLVVLVGDGKGHTLEMVLDNRYDELMTRRDLENLNYRWVTNSIQIDGALIEPEKTPVKP